MLPSGKVHSYIAIATACTCILVAVCSILKRPELVSVHIHSCLPPNPWPCGYSYKMRMQNCAGKQASLGIAMCGIVWGETPIPGEAYITVTCRSLMH